MQKQVAIKTRSYYNMTLLKNPSSLYEENRIWKVNYKDINILLKVQILLRNTKMSPIVNYYCTEEEKEQTITTSIY